MSANLSSKWLRQSDRICDTGEDHYNVPIEPFPAIGASPLLTLLGGCKRVVEWSMEGMMMMILGCDDSVL